MHRADFAAVTAITAVDRSDSGHFTAEVHPDWTIGGKPNGGYLLAMLGRAVAAVSPHPHALAASAHYLRSPDPGPVDLQIEILRAGRNASQLRARLVQDGKACIEALFTQGTLSPEAEPYWSGSVPTPGTEQRDAAYRLPATNPAGLPVPIMEQVDLRIERSSLGFARGTPSGSGELRGFLALADGVDFDPVSLLFAVDAFPPATFEVELTGWVPTLELTVYVRALPAPGPLRVVQRAHLIDGGRVDEACWLWDSTGRVVAHGVQLAGIRLG